MKKCPKIGARVRCDQSLTHGAFTGTVMRIYPSYEYDEARECETNKPLPEPEWHVCVKVDSIPQLWPYPGTDLIAPPVEKLRVAREHCRKERG